MSKIMSVIFLFLLVLMPAGSFLGVNFKIITLLLFLASLVYERENNIISSIIKRLMAPLLLILLLVLYATFVNLQGVLYLYQAKDLVIFFVVSVVLLSYFNDSEKISLAFKVIILSLVFSAFIKASMLAYSFITGYPIIYLVKAYGRMFGMSLMTYSIDGSSLGRIQFLSDFIIPISLYYMMKIYGSGHFKKIDYFYFLMLCFSVFIGMSRFYWAVSALFIFIGILFNVKGKKFLYVSFLVFLFLVGASSNDSVQASLEARFSTQKATASDDVRDLQLNLFSKKIYDSPLLGEGLGYYVPEYQQEGDTRYTYELQLPALLMQIGVVGVILLLSVLLIPIMRGIKGAVTIKNILIVNIAFWSWFASGFFNPVLFSSAGGVCYATCIFIMKVASRKAPE